LISNLVHALTEAIARRSRRYRIDASPAKVNVGSGLVVAPGWINVDMGFYPLLHYLPSRVLSYLHGRSGWATVLSRDQYVRALKTHRFIQHDARRALPFADNAVDFLLASHFLDSITSSEGRRFLEDAFRVLKPGGAIRISVSDLERNVELYRSGRKQEALARFFPVSNSPLGRRYSMYDYEILSAALTAAGFREVRRCKYREGVVPDLEILDNRPEESLFVEARKIKTD
jgi:predicted SAM-dependent methyltransferase